MISMRFCGFFTLAVMMTTSQALKCIQCSSAKNADKECTAGTKAATDCPTGDTCQSLYSSDTDTIARTCTTKALAEVAKKAAETAGLGLAGYFEM